MCYNILGEAVDPPNDKAKSSVNQMRYVMIVQLILGAFKLSLGLL